MYIWGELSKALTASGHLQRRKRGGWMSRRGGGGVNAGGQGTLCRRRCILYNGYNRESWAYIDDDVFR